MRLCHRDFEDHADYETDLGEISSEEGNNIINDSDVDSDFTLSLRTTATKVIVKLKQTLKRKTFADQS